MHLKIPRLYDSHTHFLATGEFATGLMLFDLPSAEAVRYVSLQDKTAFRGGWLVGFGWDENKWADKKLPTKQQLDEIFPNYPVYLCRADGHTAWVNSAALKKLGLQSDSGLLSEKDHLQSFERIPPFAKAQQRQQILAACKLYNRAGFTHIRDMSCTDSLWNLLVEMEEAGELTLAIEENYTVHELNQLDKAIASVLVARKTPSRLLRAKGIKFFYDGSLGSETALLSRPYNGEGNNFGKTLWSLEDAEELMKLTWAAGLEVSVHTIGDEAAHQMVKSARKVSAQGFVGRLNLEHAQVLRNETIQMMKPLHVRCHMQPCHWLSDRKWLQQKLRGLYSYAFPWEALKNAQIPISFGCDSPIEATSFFANRQALEESPKDRIKKFTGDLSVVHGHPDASYTDSWTIINGNEIEEVVFDGKPLDLKS
ncbi:amidohydrolase [Bdellovibrio sp. HCB209]|uniref:amidohydrolase n=1 Tax=Bdellovibrio sp. HCB209 TaxID=3394354 RepID=UPI0039B3FB46